MGLNACIYKHSGEDFSNGGISSRFNEVCLVNVEGPFHPDAEHPACGLVAGNVKGTLKVIAIEDIHKQISNGGCFVSTSDSRFGEAAERILGHMFYGAVPLHDRVE